MSIVAGKDCSFYAFDGGIWKPYVCGRSITLNLDTSTIETTAPGSGNFKTFIATVHSFTATADGVISLNVSGALGLAELQALQLAKTRLLCRFNMTSQANDTYAREAYFIITNSTDTGSFDGVATFQISLQGTGALTTVFTPPTPNQGEVYRYPAAGGTAPAAEGVFTVTIPGAGGKVLLSVVKAGIERNNIITAGTPVDQEVLAVTVGSDMELTFPQPFEGWDTWYALYQNT